MAQHTESSDSLTHSRKLLQRYLDRVDRDRSTLCALRGILEGEAVFCMGNGPSLRKIDPSQFDNCNVIGTNYAFEYLKNAKPKEFLSISTDSGRLMEIIRDDSRLEDRSLFAVAPSLLDDDWMNCVEENQDILVLPTIQTLALNKEKWSFILKDSILCNFDLYNNMEHCGQSVIFAALQFAYFLGAQDIFLVGVDMDYERSHTHFRESITHVNLRYQYDVHARGAFIHFKQVFERVGVRLSNATAGGKIDVLERTSLKNAIAYSQRSNSFIRKLKRRNPNFVSDVWRLFIQINHIVNTSKQRNVYIRGSGKGGQMLANIVRQRNGSISGFLTNEQIETSKQLGTPPKLSASNYDWLPHSQRPLVVIASSFSAEIIKELEANEDHKRFDYDIIDVELLASGRF